MHVLTAQPTAVRTAYCVIASQSVFSNIVGSRLISLGFWYDSIHFGVTLESLKLKVDYN